jgi:hypothetical protein
MQEKKSTAYQLFTAQRKELLAKLDSATIKCTVSGEKSMSRHFDSETFVVTLKDGRIITASCVRSPTAGSWGPYIYTVDLAGEVLTTDTAISPGHGYGSEAKLIWLDIKRKFISNNTMGVVKAINAFSRK